MNCFKLGTIQSGKTTSTDTFLMDFIVGAGLSYSAQATKEDFKTSPFFGQVTKSYSKVVSGFLLRFTVRVMPDSSFK
jgi:hypothetical protein